MTSFPSVPLGQQTASGEAQVDKTIAIKPGWKDGTRITFEREGDEQPGMVPAGMCSLAVALDRSSYLVGSPRPLLYLLQCVPPG